MLRVRRILLLGLSALIGLSVPAFAQTDPRLPVRGAAPELRNNVFLNVESPLRLADLRGQVVLLEFWTFDCINCIRTLPYVQAWHETYADQGLVVIGNHYPEFGYERDLGNLAAAIDRFGVTYPVAQDNARATWTAYNQRFWPTMYLIDKAGNIRYFHIGEGKYTETEAAIRALLAEPYTPDDTMTEATITREYLIPTEPLNVRKGPGVNYDRVGTVMPDTVFVVLSESDGWYEIEYDGKPGHYVSGEYVQVGEW